MDGKVFSPIWVVAGLGNPGRKYSKTRHNAGFMAVDELAARHGGQMAEKAGYAIAEIAIGGSRAVLVKPLTYMNLSGQAVRAVLQKKGISPEHLIVIHDDMDLEAARLRVRKNGSSGGHRGVESVIRETGTINFIRVRIGIGRDPAVPAETYVLQKFSKEESVSMKEAVSSAALAVEIIISEGLEKAMNRFNPK
ncbi:MAG: aminoacyl-tRNA hydrolase [Nitrospiraceae bacterium]|nr:aminoacyl-tRNA hydrolase [Nitrospiraceae bacterium]